MLNKEEKRRIMDGMPSLSEMYERIKLLDPLSGPNIARRAARIFTDNGDGTMTMNKRENPLE